MWNEQVISQTSNEQVIDKTPEDSLLKSQQRVLLPREQRDGGWEDRDKGSTNLY